MKEKKCLGPVGGQSRKKEKKKKTDSNGRKFHTHTHGKKMCRPKKKKSREMRQPTHNEHLRLLTQIWATINSRYSRGDKMAARSQHQISLMAINSRRGFHLKTSNRMAMMTNHDDGDQQRRWSHDDDDQFTGMFPLEDGRILMAMIGSLPLLFGMMTRETMDEPPNVTYARVLA